MSAGVFGQEKLASVKAPLMLENMQQRYLEATRAAVQITVKVCMLKQSKPVTQLKHLCIMMRKGHQVRNEHKKASAFDTLFCGCDLTVSHLGCGVSECKDD